MTTTRPVEHDSVAKATSERKHSKRWDIQGLRALAVGLVVLYHLRPDRVPGGFIGVDVFFAISGYLIIGMLGGEVVRSGRVRMLDFYARRIRRLLPAASVCLLVTVAATIVILPISRWTDVFTQVAASALDIQNWALAFLAGDYAHATAAASPVQHFWSLSVEEQCYLLLPVLLVISAVIAARLRRTVRPWAIGIVALVTVASFVFSVLYTPLDHGAAYYVTPDRVWELGIGGLAAMLTAGRTLTVGVRALLGWGGLVAVLITAFVYTTDMAFPGWIAAVPVLGTVALLVSGIGAERHSWWTPGALLSLRPVTYVGDISYSLYLWHWPVIVFLLAYTDSDLLSKKLIAIALVLSFGLAAVSKHFVEDPFLRTRKTKAAATVQRPRRPPAFVLGASLILLVFVAAAVPYRFAQVEIAALEAKSVLDPAHPGALAMDPNHPRPAPTGVPLVPAPAIAAKDYPLLDRPGCNVYDYANKPANGSACTYGSMAAPKTLVIVGDSHAAQFSTALADFAQSTSGWRVKVMVRNGCPFSAVPPSSSTGPLGVCAGQNFAELKSIIAMRPALVVTSAMVPESYRRYLQWGWSSSSALVSGYVSMLRPLTGAGIPVAVIRDVPQTHNDVPECLEKFGQDEPSCDTSRGNAIGVDPLVQAAQQVPGVNVVDLTPWLCTASTCPAVIGNVVVYRDNHLTNTFMHTLSVPLTTALGLR